jgi:GTP-binding protein
MFCDQTQLKLIGGKGGKGSIGFRREKFVPKGGPNGGDGGRGGHIYLKVNHALNSMIDLHTYKKFVAEAGEMGLGQNCHGKNADDLYLEVPLGTIVRQIIRDKNNNIAKKVQIADLSRKDAIMLVVKGGKGGFGNAHFINSVRQAPKFAELGEDGEEIEVELELKLVADIGIIGIPSAGKSSLISVISNARPKIAAYPFTTLIPNLGVVKMGEKDSYVVADIPGLIEGAHQGKGLGVEFLKHVQRCRILVHLIDPTQLSLHEGAAVEQRPTISAAIDNFRLINKELTAFSRDLAKKEQIVVINKIDAIQTEEEKELRKALKKEIGRKKRFTLYPEAISAATTQGVKELKIYLHHELQKIPKPEWLREEVKVSEGEETDTEPSSGKEHILYRPHLENPKYYSVEKVSKGIYRIKGQRLEQIINMTDFNNRDAVRRVKDVFKKLGVDKELRKAGVKDGDTVHVGKRELEYQSDL